jgi:hypothetical protein
VFGCFGARLVTFVRRLHFDWYVRYVESVGWLFLVRALRWFLFFGLVGCLVILLIACFARYGTLFSRFIRLFG